MSDPSPARTVTFFFDPNCPWTWLTSRWLVDASDRTDVEVEYRAFSLNLINEGTEVPPQFVDMMDVGVRALRVVESLVAEGRQHDVAAFYTEYGTRSFIDGAEVSDDLIEAAGIAAGIEDVMDRAHDETHDGSVRAAYDEIRDVVGDEVGSPALRLESTGNAIFGPIVSPAPTGDDAVKVLDATITLLEIPQFFELKRSRTDGPDFT